MTTDILYPFAKARYEQLNRDHDTASGNLKEFLSKHETGLMGLTPDCVKAMPEYQELKTTYDAAFNSLRNFNATYQKQFKKHIQQERRAKGR